MLITKIQKLIARRTEGSYWDFKQEWHANKGDLLHDIICMANNLEDSDAYIIIGVTDNGQVCGVPEANRRNQQNVIDFLKDKSFAGGIRPTVYVQNLLIDDKPVDVIIIKNTSNTPYYLNKNFGGLHSGNIYTRVSDTNTPKNGNADIDKVEWLWRKRFGLVGNFDSRMKRILQADGWVCEDRGGWQEHFFNEYYPEIRIDVNADETSWQKENCTSHDSFFYLYSNSLFWNMHSCETLTRKCYDICWYGNRIRQFFTISAPKMYFDFVEPEITFLNNDLGILLEDNYGPILGATYAYFTKDSVNYMLLKKIAHLQQAHDALDSRYGANGPFCAKVVPVFSDKKEYSDFMKYIYQNRNRFYHAYHDLNITSGFYFGAEAKNDPRINQSLKVGTLLVEWLDEWRKQPPVEII